jgi:hypothetical protein
MKARILLPCFILLIQAPWGWAQGTLAWWYDNTNYVVGPSDQILVTGTIANSSLDPYTIPGAGANFSGDLQKVYDFTFLLDLYGHTVPGHGVLQFPFGLLTPIKGYVQPGTYVADPAWIGFGGSGPISPENNFHITVQAPEPSVPGLGGAGLMLFGAVQSWRRRSANQGRIRRFRLD